MMGEQNWICQHRPKQDALLTFLCETCGEVTNAIPLINSLRSRLAELEECLGEAIMTALHKPGCAFVQSIDSRCNCFISQGEKLLEGRDG